MYLLQSKHEGKTQVKCRTVCKDCGGIYFAFVFACVVGKNLKTPDLSPMADDAITLGGIYGLGSSLSVDSTQVNEADVALTKLGLCYSR